MSVINGVATVSAVLACPALFLTLIGETPWTASEPPASTVTAKADVTGDAARIERMFVPTESVIIADAAEPGWPEIARDPFIDWGPVIPLAAAEPASKTPARKAAPQVQRAAAANASKQRSALQRSSSGQRSPWDAIMYGSGSGVGRYRDRAFAALFGSERDSASGSGSGMRNNPYSGRISRSAGRSYYRKWYQ